MVSIIVSISFLSMEGSNVAYFYRKRSVVLHEEVIAGLKVTIVFIPKPHGHGYLFIKTRMPKTNGWHCFKSLRFGIYHADKY